MQRALFQCQHPARTWSRRDGHPSSPALILGVCVCVYVCVCVSVCVRVRVRVCVRACVQTRDNILHNTRRELLTSKANMALGSSSAVTVRVVSKVLCSLKAPSLNAADAAAASVKSSTHGRRAGGWEGGDGEQNKTTVTYTRKAILTFQHLKGADVLIMGMYVQQYGPDSSPLHKGRVLIECIDSPPVWPVCWRLCVWGGCGCE